MEMGEANGPILEALDDMIEPFGNGVGHTGAGSGQHDILIASEGTDELAHQIELAELGRLTRPCDRLKLNISANQATQRQLLHILSALERAA